MKRGTPAHPKVPDLAGRLGIPTFAAVGILECLWHWTAQFAMDGGIGKWSNYAITSAINGYSGDPDALIDALIASTWIDKSDNDDVRLLVHDWPDHCEDAVHRALARKVAYFADGSRPNLSRLEDKEREKIKSLYLAKDKELNSRAPNVRPECAQSAPAVRPALALADALAFAKADADADAPPCAQPDSANTSAGSHLTKKKRRENSQSTPSPVAEVIPDIMPAQGAEDTRTSLIAETVDEILSLTHEPHWRDWWLVVCGTLWDSVDGWQALCGLVDHVRDCSNEATRRAKDLGELQDAGGFMVKRTTTWMKAQGLRWPAFPGRDRKVG